MSITVRKLRTPAPENAVESWSPDPIPPGALLPTITVVSIRGNRGSGSRSFTALLQIHQPGKVAEPRAVPFSLDVTGHVLPEIPLHWHQPSAWADMIAQAIDAAEWPAELGTKRLVSALIPQPSRPSPADWLRKAKTAREFIAELENVRVNLLRNPRKNVADDQRFVSDIDDVVLACDEMITDCEAKHREATLAFNFPAREKIDGDRDRVKEYRDAFRAQRDKVVAELPERELIEAEAAAAWRRSMAELDEREAGQWDVIASGLPVLEKVAVATGELAAIRAERRRIAAAAMLQGITIDNGVRMPARFRTSAARHNAPGDWIDGLRVPGLAPADADQPPPWLYLAPER